MPQDKWQARGINQAERCLAFSIAGKRARQQCDRDIVMMWRWWRLFGQSAKERHGARVGRIEPVGVFSIRSGLGSGADPLQQRSPFDKAARCGFGRRVKGGLKRKKPVNDGKLGAGHLRSGLRLGHAVSGTT
ncbi:hypothetical protein [Gemmobacter aquaticus]|nr:hypothetical protein [Gemmobacter aquaticus]